MAWAGCEPVPPVHWEQLEMIVPTILADGLAPSTEASREQPVFATARGECRPFGATPGPDGVNFAVFSRHAHQVDLLLFKEGRDKPVAEIPLDPGGNRTGDVWH